jgi:hypothetical protein
MAPSALAGPEDKARQVPRSVTDKGHRVAAKDREDELSRLAVRDGLKRVRVEYLGDVAILPYVHAGAEHALERDARPVHFAHAVAVIHLDAEPILDLLPKLLGVGLGAGDCLLEPQVGARKLGGFLDGRVQVQKVTRRCVDHGRPKILHELQLPDRVARARRMTIAPMSSAP